MQPIITILIIATTTTIGRARALTEVLVRIVRSTGSITTSLQGWDHIRNFCDTATLRSHFLQAALGGKYTKQATIFRHINLSLRDQSRRKRLACRLSSTAGGFGSSHAMTSPTCLSALVRSTEEELAQRVIPGQRSVCGRCPRQ